MTFSEAAGMVVSFGMHRGESLLRIAQVHPSYLAWMIHEFDDGPMKSAAILVSENCRQESLSERLKRVIAREDWKERSVNRPKS